MASWILVPCLVSLRDEFNALAPGRDKSSDGSVGDTAHSQNSSDHNPDETGSTPSEDADSINEVHAIDVDKELRRAGWSMERAVQIIVLRHRNGQDDRLQNVIYNRRIWSRSWGWTEHAYTGPNAHTEHAHFSARYTTAQETDTRPWGLLNIMEDDVSAADVIEALESKAGQAAVFKAWFNGPIGKNPVKAAVLLQNTAGGVAALQLAATKEAGRDAQTAAILAGMQTALSALASTNGVLTPAQVAALTDQVRAAARVAGAEAVTAVTGRLDQIAGQVASLSDHLGDDAVQG